MAYSKRLVLVSLNSRFIQSNTAVYYLHEILSAAGYQCPVLNHTINEDFHTVLGSIMESEPDIVCFSCYIWNINEVYELCRGIRKIKRDIKILLGGPEVSFCPEEALRESGADLIIRGEAETVISAAVRGLSCNEMPDMEGLFYKEGDSFIDSGYAMTTDMDDIPFAFTPYMMNSEKEKLIYYESSRGCPFSCIYCLSSAITGVRYISLDRVRSELGKILEYEPSVIKFTDRSFNSNQERAMELLELIRDLDTNTCFHLEIYPGTMKEPLIEKLSEMPPGRVQIEAGIQSTDGDVLEKSKRLQEPGKALHNISRLVEGDNLHVHVDLIAGLPGDSMETFIRSFNQTIGTFPHILQVGFLKLLKGTEIRNVPEYEYQDRAPYEVLSSDSMDYHEIQEIREIAGILDMFYNSGNFREYFRHNLSNHNNPYGFFSNLLKHIKKKDLKGAGISRDGKYEILAGFLDNDTDSLDYLGIDFLSSYKSKVLPGCLGGKILDRENTFEYLKGHGNPKGIYEARTLYKTCTIAGFLLKGKSKMILFDYSDKNPVTGLYRKSEVVI